jgi:hypothetical protein
MQQTFVAKSNVQVFSTLSSTAKNWQHTVRFPYLHSQFEQRILPYVRIAAKL